MKTVLLEEKLNSNNQWYPSGNAITNSNLKNYLKIIKRQGNRPNTSTNLIKYDDRFNVIECDEKEWLTLPNKEYYHEENGEKYYYRLVTIDVNPFHLKY